MKNKLLSLIFSPLLVAFCSSGANATTVNFTDPLFQAGHGLNTFTTTVDGIDLTLSSFSFGLPVGSLYWDPVDGYGVAGLGYQPDEIEGVEALLISFSQEVMLTEVNITDLFIEGSFLGTYAETGTLQINGGAPINFSAISAGNNGALTLSFTDVMASSILFTAPGIVLSNLPPYIQSHEYSLGGVSFTAVPEPASLLLLGSGLLGAFGLKRRKSNITAA